jgi:hypothetical protein
MAQKITEPKYHTRPPSLSPNKLISYDVLRILVRRLKAREIEIMPGICERQH